MNDAYDVFFISMIVLACLVLLFYLVQLLATKLINRTAVDAIETDLNAILDSGTCPNPRRYRRKRNCVRLLDSFILLLQNLDPGEAERKRGTDFFCFRKLDSYFITHLHSKSSYKRSRSAHYLGYFGGVEAAHSLRMQLEKERKENVKLYLIYALCLLNDVESLSVVISAVKGSSILFIQRVSGILSAFPSLCITLFYNIKDKKDPDLILLVTKVARITPYRIFPQYLTSVFLDPECSDSVRRTAFECLMDSYPEMLDPANFLNYKDEELEHIAILALGKRPTRKNAELLIERAAEEKNSEYAFSGLSDMIRRSDDLFMYMINRFHAETNGKTVRIIARVLAARFEYFLPGFEFSTNRNDMIISELLRSGNVSEFISFLNRNTSSKIENRLVSVIQREIHTGRIKTKEFQMYLKETILQKIGLQSLPLPQNDQKGRKEFIKQLPLRILLTVIIMLPVLIFAVIYLGNPSASIKAIGIRFLDVFLWGFGYYALILDCFYFFLSALSLYRSTKERNYFALKPISFFFYPHIVPSVSILSPAFCEQETIIESVESLLNINYPDFEVIVINDGSTDNTLQLLISHFHLEKTDIPYKQQLQTQSVRGIYKNPGVPELTVIDKLNGGKADSLNAGLNISSKEYVLGTDSDCIIEQDALLKMTAPFIDESKTVMASGGVIIPANGCTVGNGCLIHKRVPDKMIPLFQTIEYFRAFLNNRMGWSVIRSLMIISGAFGLFRRKEVLDVRGYLTSKEKYTKDTVGEDMELLIRIVRDLKEKSKQFRILYSSESVLWTEVPSSLRSLERQRSRWQRGLIDILLFHRKMFFNPRYGSHGMFGFPYYWLVEVIGPWYQLFAIIFLVMGLLTHLVSLDVLLFIITTNLIISFILTIISVYIGNMEKDIFTVRDQITLIFGALLETFGFRQIISFFRITGFISTIRKVSGWNKFDRTGFKREERNS